MPTGGVDLQTAESFLKAGVCCLGVGSALVEPAAVASGDFDRLRDLASQYAAIVRRFTHRGEGWRLTPPAETDPSPRLLKVLGGLALVLLLVEGWGATTDRNYKATGNTIEGSQYLNPDEPMWLEVLPREEP